MRSFLVDKRSRYKSLERLDQRRNEKPNLPAAERRPYRHGSTRLSGVCRGCLPAGLAEGDETPLVGVPELEANGT
jgi:hypothetical protein